jgi:hypothetical protein
VRLLRKEKEVRKNIKPNLKRSDSDINVIGRIKNGINGLLRNLPKF